MTTADHRPVGDVLKRRCETSNLCTSVEQRLYIEVPVRWRNSSDGPSGCAVVELEQNAQQFAASNVDKVRGAVRSERFGELAQRLIPERRAVGLR
jgi:hypothetical protein